MKDKGRKHYYIGIWVDLAISWRFWSRYGKRRIETVMEFHRVYETMG
jgi:hypothetical protein